MKFTTTLSLVPFVLAGDDRIRFGRSMHKRSRILTAIPTGDGRLNAAMASNEIDVNPLPSGYDAPMISNTIGAIEQNRKIFVQEKQRKLKTPMFSDRLLQTSSSNDFAEGGVSIAFVDMSYSMAMSIEFFSMAPTETETTTSTTVTPPSYVTTGTPPTVVSTGTPPTAGNSTFTPPTEGTTDTPPTEVTTDTPPTDVSTTTTAPTEPISEQHFGNMIVSTLISSIFIPSEITLTLCVSSIYCL
jgi:hypothetical protein